jgi:hypothetical protein
LHHIRRQHDVVPRERRADALGEAAELHSGVLAARLPQVAGLDRGVGCTQPGFRGRRADGLWNRAGPEVELLHDLVDRAVHGMGHGTERVFPQVALLVRRGPRNRDLHDLAFESQPLTAGSEHDAGEPLEPVEDRRSERALFRVDRREVDEKRQPQQHRLPLQQVQ